MKKLIQAILQKVLGFDNYLFIFSLIIMHTLRWNKKERDIRHLLTLLKKDSIVLDIGANIGIMTVILAKKCKKGKVFAFEPVPDNFRALKRILNFTSVKNVELFQVALGEDRQKVQMKMPIMSGVKMQGLSHIEHTTIVGYQTPDIAYEVQQLALDDIEQFDKLKISAIKIDVENYEQFVLRGGINLIQRDKPIIYCELWDNDNRRACFELLRAEGYQPTVHIKGKLYEYKSGKHSQQNFFFLPKKD